MSTRKRIVLILIALVVIGLLWLSFRPQPVPVSVAEVGRGPLQVTVQQEGHARVRDRYVISSPVAGQAARLPLEVGDPVQAGQVLLTLRPTPPVPLDARSRAQAQAQVAEAEAAYELARSELERMRPLAQRGDLSQSALDQARAAAERARASLAAARAALAYSAGERGAAVETIELRSPVDGRVLAIEHKSEAVVAPGAPLLAVGDPQRLEAAMDVLSTDAVQLRPGMRVLFRRWGGGGDLEGRVRIVEPAAFTKVSALGVEEQRVWVIADFTSPREQWENLGDGYRVEASFVLWEADDVLQVPASALFRENGQWAAFVVEGGLVHKRAVRVGQRGGLQVQVLDGLALGERVVTHPDDALAEGGEVVLRGEGP